MRALHLLTQPGLVDLRQPAALGALNWYHAHRIQCSGSRWSIAGAISRQLPAAALK
jgi:hypothetical protein